MVIPIIGGGLVVFILCLHPLLIIPVMSYKLTTYRLS